MTEQQVGTAPAQSPWLQDQVYQLKSQVAQLEQQLEHARTGLSDLSEHDRSIEAGLRQAVAQSAQLPNLQTEINQAVALIVQLQDGERDLSDKLAQLLRRREQDDDHSQQDWSDSVRRIEQLERHVAAWQDRQAGVDEVGRRFQEDSATLSVEIRQLGQRLEIAEAKAGRSLESASRGENTLTHVEASILELQRETETIAERARVAAEIGHRLESSLSEKLQRLDRMELLAERIELHRAERQRLEDRAIRLEEELRELSTRVDTSDQEQLRLRGQQQGSVSRIEALQEQLQEEKALVLGLLRKLLGTEERSKRRQVQELEREIREMKQYVAGLSDESI
jgi:chromosome segregation ATPase